MSAVPAESPLALAVVAALVAELGANLAGYGKKPSAGGWQTTGTPTPQTQFKGYAVVYAGQTGPLDGPADYSSFDATRGWQVTAVGSSAEQADAIRDRCREALMTTRLTVTGRHVGPTQLSDGQNATVDNDVNPPVYYAVERYAAYTSPA